MTWAQLNIPEAPETGNTDFDTWMSQVVKYLRDYLGAFHDRGDPAGYDFSIGDLTQDSWTNLDLSGIVSAEATAVSLQVRIQDAAASSYILFRKEGNSNNYNRSVLRTQVGGIVNDADLIVFCDSNRVVEYYAAGGGAFTALDITVKGWWK